MQVIGDSLNQECRRSPTSSDSGVNIEEGVIYKNGIDNVNLINKNKNEFNPRSNNDISDQETNYTNNNDNIIVDSNCKSVIESPCPRGSHKHRKYDNDDISNDSDSEEVKSSTVSSHSNRISIISIDDGVDSSVIDSDSDNENELPFSRDYIVKKLGEQVKVDAQNDVVVINQKLEGQSCPDVAHSAIPSKPQIGTIAVQNSSDITFGNKTFYHGPVTIKQFVLEKKNQDSNEFGKDNPGFDGSDNNNETNQRNNAYELNPGFLNYKKLINHKLPIISGAVLLIVLVIAALVFTIQAFQNTSSYTNPGDGDDSRKNIPINSSIGHDNIAGGKVLRIVSRDEWIAQPPMHELGPLEIPTFRVIIAHTATEGCATQAICTFRVRFIQTFHIESRNFDDIAYNFLVGGDGSVYEGRGWDKEGAHTKGYNKGSICVAFIGTFMTLEPPEKQLRAAKLIIEEGVRLGKLKPDYKLYGHRQLIPSESPGEALYKIIQKWSHWTNEI